MRIEKELVPEQGIRPAELEDPAGSPHVQIRTMHVLRRQLHCSNNTDEEDARIRDIGIVQRCLQL